MRWLVSGRLLKKGPEEGMARFGREMLSRLAELMHEAEWVVVVDGLSAELPFTLPRSRVEHVPVSSHHPPGMLLYLEYWLPRVARETGAEAFLSPDGWTPLSLKIPTFPVIHDINFERNPEWIALHWRFLYRYYFPRIARKAQHVFTVSDFSSKELSALYALPPDKLTVTPNASSEVFRPLSDEEKCEARLRFNDGKPYLLVPTTLHPRKNVLNVLRAYRKALRINPELPLLLFTGGTLWSNDTLEKEIRFLQDQGKLKRAGLLSEREMAWATGGAEAVIYLSLYEGFGLPVVEAQAAGVPVLASGTTALPETGGGGCLYADTQDTDDIAEKLLKICDDHTLRKRLTDEGLINLNRFSWDSSARTMAEKLKILTRP